MAAIQVQHETETGPAWAYDVRVQDARGVESRHAVKLSWADYDYWSGGSTEPATVVHKLFEFLLDRTSPAELRTSFDAGLVRRLYPEVDDVLPGML